MKAIWMIVAGFLCSGIAHAATGFTGGFYFVTSLNGGGNVFNQITTGTTPGFGAAQGHNLTPDGVNPQFASFGTLDLTDSLVLKGFEYKTFQTDGSNVSHANLFYRIYPTGSPGGTFSQIQTTSSFLDGSGNKVWQVTSGTTNLLNGLTPGNYTINIFTESYTNGVNTAGNIFGFTTDSPTANFTVIPEPTGALLGVVCVMGLLRRRRA